MSDKLSLKELISQGERLGVIGSPSSTTELTLDILATAVTKKLVGELGLFSYYQDEFEHYALGQITEVSLRNVWHEDFTMRSIIRQRGAVKAVSERQDTHQGEMVISAVFAEQGEQYVPSILGTVPATGTFVQLVDDSVIDTVLSPYKDELFYLGNVYGSTPKLPLWFRHFGTGNKGAGEAYHLGVFGKTGSGKSVLAKTILLGYARHKNMGLFVLDPQGEFAKDLRNPPNEVESMGNVLHPDVLKTYNREFQVYDLDNFRLGTWELLGKLLTEFRFFQTLGIKYSDYQEIAADYTVDFLRNENKYKLSRLNDEAYSDVLQNLHNKIEKIYSTDATVNKIKDTITQEISDLAAKKFTDLKTKWDQAISFFASNVNGESKKLTVGNIISQTLNKKNNQTPLVVVDLSKKPDDISHAVWDDKIKPLLIDNFLSVLIRKSEEAFQGNKGLNTLVVLDEASRLAPQGKADNDRKQRIKTRLVDAVRTTRKYGLGWMFISQTLSSLDNEVVQQLRISFFGFGLSMGAEYQKLKELVGGQDTYLKLYRQFRDPQSTFGTTGEYSFMTVGPVSPLSFAGTPLFFNAFNDVKLFIEANDLQIISQPSFLS